MSFKMSFSDMESPLVFKYLQKNLNEFLSRERRWRVEKYNMVH